ncbi:hypothetical protein [Glutamicibacter arilaitensis]|uniref:hypothetical protein n=1 Tax=Glutamicibacter arilaitensis TaxID=256701 RepID=UPI0015E18A61|nr:hypothetical protein [Glutamicibacter arilaitensis]
MQNYRNERDRREHADTQGQASGGGSDEGLAPEQGQGKERILGLGYNQDDQHGRNRQ